MAPRQPPPPGSWGQAPPSAAPQPFVPRPPRKKSVWPWVLGGLGLLVVIGVVGVAIALGIDAGSDGATSTTDDEAQAEGRSPSDTDASVTGDDDEVDDVEPCEWVDEQTIVFDITNNSSESSSYVIDVNFLDAAGTRVGDEPFFVNYVRPGERTVEAAFVFDSSGGVDCEIAEVERYADPSPDDIEEVSCSTAGVDFADDVATTFMATNGSSEVSDYFVTAALVKDGLRIGTAFASIENVRPGQSAPGDGFSVVDGPDDGVSCEVVHVSRTSSE